MIQLTLIIGFLGSGKTTLLKRINELNSESKLVFLVNDFSANEVDAALLANEKEDIVSVAGGSIFCKCLVTEFVNRMREIPRKFPETDGVIIEASGVANPAVIGQMLSETKLNQIYRMNTIITVVDPLTLPVLLKTLPNIKTQLQLADQVILNKTDLVENNILEQIRAIIVKINDRTKIIETRFCRLDYNPLQTEGETMVMPSAEAAHPPQPQYARFSMKSAKKLRLHMLDDLLQKHAGSVYRVKGFIRDEKGDIRYVDYSSSGLKFEKHERPENLSLEFIFNENKKDNLLADIRQFHKRAFIS